MRKSSPQSSETFDRQAFLGASFRDPAGYVFRDQYGVLLRQINKAGQADYELLLSSGLYEFLISHQLLVSHEWQSVKSLPSEAFAVIKPTAVPVISYPFEWSFSQLQDAALLTLNIQKTALRHGMSLKDASAYNVQFLQGRPIFIDTLSFEKYTTGEPWQAYRQFCQHFLAPLSLMAYTDLSLSQLLRIHMDGIPLELATKLLPRHAKLRLGIMLHLLAHGKAQRAKANQGRRPNQQVPQTNLEAIIGSLERTVKKLTPHGEATEWGDYYNHTNYTADAADEKARLLVSLLRPLPAKTALDLGGNNGRYSRVLHSLGLSTICTDIDPNAVDANYRFARQQHEQLMLPLLIDLTNPGGGLGWANNERQPIHERLQADIVVALALIHHLAISNNVPFAKLADYFSRFGEYLLLEFVPKDDSQVQKLLATRKDIFPGYNETGLKHAFAEWYTLIKESPIAGSKRTLYLFKRK